MSRILQLRRGTSIELDAITGAEGEIFVDLTNNTLRIHNSVIQGGTSLASETYVNNEVSTAIADLASETYVDNAIAAIEVDFSMIMEDIIPAISGVYDIGTPDHQWYNGYFTNKVDINGIEFTNIGDNDLQITAETIITDSDLLANSLLLDDIFITGNIIKPLSTPLYGQREVIVDGGLHVASEDAAYIRLTQEPTITQISQSFSNVEDGFVFTRQYTDSSYDGFFAALYTDVSQIAPELPQEMWLITSPSYSQILANSLTPGVKYQIKIEVIVAFGVFSNERTVVASYLLEDVEYIGSRFDPAPAANVLAFKIYSGLPLVLGIDYLVVDEIPSLGIPSNTYIPASIDFVISTNTLISDYSVLDTYGSEGMIRFNPEIKKFEGHDGTKWDSVTAVDPVTVYVKNASFSVTTSLTVNETDVGCFNNFLGSYAGCSNTTGSSNNFFGRGAGCSNTTGYDNNFFGLGAGRNNITGSFNNFFGFFAGRNNITGCYNNFFGSYAGSRNTTGINNNFFGFCAGAYNSTGYDNNFFGRGAGRFNTTGSNNNFFGDYAGRSNSTGCNNNFFGAYAGLSNTTGGRNNFFGRGAGYSNISGFDNNFFGCGVGFANTTGGRNNFLGYYAGRCNTTGSSNNFIGYLAGRFNTSGSSNNFFGYYAGYSNTTGCFNNFFGLGAGRCNESGCNNNFFGCNAGRCNTTGSSNNFFGVNAGHSNTTGINNNFIGVGAGYFNTTGNNNNFFGCSAGRYNTTGINNNFIGRSAGFRNTTGSYNTFIGRCTGYFNTTGNNNNFFGDCAGFCNTTGSDNFFAGACAGFCNTTGCNNLFFGCDSGTSNGLACITTQSNRIIMGNSSHTCAQIQVAWTVVSDIRDKCIFGSVPHGRGFLQQINPVKFAFKDRITGCLSDAVGKYRYGFKAQEILAAEGDDPVITSAEDPDKLQVTSDYLIPVLVNAINELSREVDNIINENKTLKDRILNLEQK
jgi:hypothetical protein